MTPSNDAEWGDTYYILGIGEYKITYKEFDSEDHLLYQHNKILDFTDPWDDNETRLQVKEKIK